MPLSASPLSRLRLAFVALAAALLVAGLGLLQSAVSRLEEQRALRHRMVAERVFDEAEREISAVLQHEAERPSEAYDVEDTDPSKWGRFVVGYYVREPALRIVAEARLDGARSALIRDAVQRAQPALDHPSSLAAKRSDASPLLAGTASSSPDVLRQLNRGVKVREKRQHDLAQSFVVGRVGDDVLVLERAGESRREGFVLSVPELVATMQSWVLSSQGLDAVATLAPSRGASPAPVRDGYQFTHQLAEPLASQRIALQLSQLDDHDASNALYGLAGLLAAAAVLGLFAIYRMVAVQIAFAERRNNFVAAVTHELRTPLTSIRMYGEMLRDGMVTDEATRKEYYATITAEGERLTRLINNVMEHARLRRGQRRAHLERANAGAVVREVAELMGPHIASEGFEVRLLIEAELPAVAIDVDALKQILFNVIDNALKYGRGDGVAVIELGCERAPGGVVVRVRDHGPGIAEAQLQAVFEPFFRGESELTRRQKGTGIGLALVRDLVELMNGSVRGENRAPGFEVCIALRLA